MGDTNPWDAAEYCASLINRISTVPSLAASEALRRLAAHSSLESYKSHIQYAIANQQQRRRDAEYERPDWSQTVRALYQGAPATVADLHALLVEQMRDMKQRIERENIDLYKQFWNLDDRGKPESPRREDTCCNYLIGLLRPKLLPLGIGVEPEPHMAGDKRADISVSIPGRKVLWELKRDYHRDVWTAAEQQLERFYTYDPEAKGFGLYCVFWFGEGSKHKLALPPRGLPRPASSAEMECILRELLPEGYKRRITVCVIDVSGTSGDSVG
jgi:hypothetical protein